LIVHRDAGWLACDPSLNAPRCGPIDLSPSAARTSTARSGKALLVADQRSVLELLTAVAGDWVKVPLSPPGSTDAAISPDGTKIAFSANTMQSIDANDIWIANVDGSGSKQLTDMPHLQHLPTWTPRGEILFLSGRGDDHHDIWIVKPGDAPRPLVQNHGYCFDPAMSDKGDLAFSSNKDGNYDIWLKPVAGGALRKIVASPSFEGQPVFSPDGERLAYVVYDERGGHLRVHELATGRDEALPIDGDIRNPIWIEGPCSGILGKH
jgi:TolB protein